MKESSPRPKAVVAFIEDALTKDYWASPMNPAPRVLPEEMEPYYREVKPPIDQFEISEVEDFLREVEPETSKYLDVTSEIEKEFGISISSYEKVKTSKQYGVHFWLCLSKDNILDLFSYSAVDNKFESIRNVSKSRLNFYLQQYTPADIQPMMMRNAKFVYETTENDNESLAYCLSTWMELPLDRARDIVSESNSTDMPEVLYLSKAYLEK